MTDYQVFISRKKLDNNGQQTEEVAIAEELHRHLTGLGVTTFLDDISLLQQATGRYKRAIDDALDSARILIAVGTSREHLESEWVRYEWDGFFNDIISGIKPDGEVISLTSGLKTADLPRALRQSQAFDYKADGIRLIGEFLINVFGREFSASPSKSAQEIVREQPAQRTLMDSGVLFLDLVGSSRLYEEHGKEVTGRLLGKALRDWSKITEKNGGWVVKAVGDEMMCGFHTAEECARAALEIREEIGIGLRGESVRISVRMGFAFGETQRLPNGDMYGSAVNVAAKMTGLARDGLMLTSEQTIRSLPGNIAAMFEIVGKAEVKGEPELVSYYKVVDSSGRTG